MRVTSKFVILVFMDIAYGYFHPMRQVPLSMSVLLTDGDPAGHPNTGTLIEITSNNSMLFCGQPNDMFSAGYAHFTNNMGLQDKHMFWWFFEARHEPENASVVLTFGGGPGGSGMLFPFGGAGPCIIKEGNDGRASVVPAPYSWTEHVNLLSIDHPVGVGYSYGNQASFRNSSHRAAWDVDDFLQAFWHRFPHLAKNQFMIHSGSYGGVYIPHVIHTINSRNAAASSHRSSKSTLEDRIIKSPETVMMGNVMSDLQTYVRWFHQSNCETSPDSNRFFNETSCSDIVRNTPKCLDAIQFAYEQSTTTSRSAAWNECAKSMPWEGVDRSPYDIRNKCPEGGCILNLTYIDEYMNSDLVRRSIGVPDQVKYKAINLEQIGDPFMNDGDIVQPAYLLLAPAINSGLRVLVYNGMADGMCPWRASLAWMKLLKTQYQLDFRKAREVEYPDFGCYIRQAGIDESGASNYTLVKIKDAGHMGINNEPEFLRQLMLKWLKHEPLL